ncbi:MAG: riboflavin kinase, partial [Candidatus Flemingiibacterium sp.]
GIYACLVEIGDRSYPGVSNVGTRPTVDDSGRINCETHIIGYSGWLYGENIKVSFYKRLRGEKRFPDVASLKAQIERDAASALEYFRAQEVK